MTVGTKLSKEWKEARKAELRAVANQVIRNNCAQHGKRYAIGQAKHAVVMVCEREKVFRPPQLHTFYDSLCRKVQAELDTL